MASLSRHLQTQGSEHERLGFRPNCPLPRSPGRALSRVPAAATERRGSRRRALVAAGALLPTVSALADRAPPVGGPNPAAPPAVLEHPGAGDGGGRGDLPPLADDDEGDPPPLVDLPIPDTQGAPPPSDGYFCTAACAPLAPQRARPRHCRRQRRRP